MCFNEYLDSMLLAGVSTDDEHCFSSNKTIRIKKTDVAHFS